MHTDTTNFFQVDYDDVLVLEGRPYLIRHNAKELRFGLEGEEKFWVKRAIDLSDGCLKIIKLVFFEKFTAHIGEIEFECFRSPRKEARILNLVFNHGQFMHGFPTEDEKGNTIRVIDFIKGEPLHTHVENMEMDHHRYFHEQFPYLLNHFKECVRAIGLLHAHGEKHGDIRRDHIIIDQESGIHRWIDFDYDNRLNENIFGHDLFGLGNVLMFLVGKGDVSPQDLKRQGQPVASDLEEEDLNIIRTNRVANLRKIYPYIPECLNRILLHFSKGAKWFYENTDQLLMDLDACEKEIDFH